MNAVGIIAEFNPFHDGHKFLIEEVKKIAGNDAVVIAMSGNYVQRGEPAILDKWLRTKDALDNGADLIVEIPSLFCLGNARQYASAAIDILNSLYCVKTQAFGSESGNLEVLREISSMLKTPIIDEKISEYSKKGYSFPRARAESFKEIYPDYKNLSILNNSNDNLALEYLSCNSNMKHIAIKRNNISATEIRNEKRASICDGYVFPEYMYELLKYAVMNMSADDIEDCPSAGEGLGNKVKKEIQNSQDWDEFIHNVKSKRYTYTRISRLCMQIILGITRGKYNIQKPKYVRVLGANLKGRELLSYIIDNELNKLPIVSNLYKFRSDADEEALSLIELESRGTEIYKLVSLLDKSEISEYKVHPIIVE